jgi:hypothetical protein
LIGNECTKESESILRFLEVGVVLTKVPASFDLSVTLTLDFLSVRSERDTLDFTGDDVIEEVLFVLVTISDTESLETLLVCCVDEV